MVRINPDNPCNYIGSKYEETKDLDIVEIAKLTRKEIKDRVKNRQLPKGKYSVRIMRYSGGQSIDINAKCNLDSDRRKEIKKVIENIVNQYNYDAGDSMTDYYSSRFCERVEVS